MAAPPSKTINDLNGTWVMNKALSDSVEPALVIQGVSWLTRKAILLTTLTLEITQFTGPPKPIDGDPPADQTLVTHIDIQQLATGGLKGTREGRCLDSNFREHKDWLFGECRGLSKWVELSEVEDEFLTMGWEEGEAEGTGPGGKGHVLSHVENMDEGGGWTATQVWGFKVVDGKRYYARNVVVKKGDDQRAELNLYYDYYHE